MGNTINEIDSMIDVYYDPIFGCTGWEFRKPIEELDQKKKKSSVQPKKNKW